MNVKVENDNLKKKITTYENTIDGEKKKLADMNLRINIII